MAGDPDPYQAQWNLRPRIDALRVEAKSLHKQTADRFSERTTEIGVARDRAARDQYAAEQAAKSADIQVGVEQKAVANADNEIAVRERQIADLEARGDRAAAEELREDVGKFAADRSAHAERARQAELDAAQLRDDAAGHQRRVTELNVERQDVVDQAGAAERNVDKMDDQVRLLEQARLKYSEADMATDVGQRATLQLQAEALVTSAGAIEVDRDLIRVMVPDLADTTPGIDADPGPLPAGAEEEISATDEPTDEFGGAGTDTSETATAGGDDALGIETFSDTASGQGFELAPAGEFDAAAVDSAETGFDTSGEPAAFFDGNGGSAESGFAAESFEVPAADTFAGDSFAADSFDAGADAEPFASDDFAAPSDDAMEFASADTFESESFDS